MQAVFLPFAVSAWLSLLTKGGYILIYRSRSRQKTTSLWYCILYLPYLS